jgi:predicted amidophosphoribosyltransferase
MSTITTFCPHCGEDVPESDKAFCDQCGANLMAIVTDIECTNCHEFIQDIDIYCRHCRYFVSMDC